MPVMGFHSSRSHCKLETFHFDTIHVLNSFNENNNITITVLSQPRTQALWFVYVIKRTWDGKMENSAGSAW